MNLEQTFLQFLKEGLAWAEAGGPEHDAFDEQQGLCPNWRRCIQNYHADYVYRLDVVEAQKWYSKLTYELCKDFSSTIDPFGWYDDKTETPSHKWEPRLTWVRNKIKELEQCA